MQTKLIPILLRLLLPKYYNRLTWALIFFVASPLLSYPIWIDFVNVLLQKYGVPTIHMESNMVVGTIVIISALAYNLCHRYIEYRQSRPNGPAYKNISQDVFPNFSSMCQAILPILKDNEYIFTHTGPNSSSQECGDLRMDLSLWNTIKIDSILPNNTKIKNIIERNKHLVPECHRQLFQELCLHINAFEKHVKDPNIDYTEHQFPKSITEVIEQTCFDASLMNPTYQKIERWLSKKSKKNGIRESYIIGSILMYPEYAQDVDVIICASNSLDVLNLLAFDFKIKFKKTLHISYFEEQNQEYIEFCEKNKFKAKIRYGKRFA